jgi:predicted regulator of Ras-like GTPase activity (Roadblock/LC7/MglB family)
VPTIRDLVAAIRRRDGIDAALVLGRDGLLIDHQANAGLDADSIAAHVPSILSHADELAAAAGQGHLLTAVHEHAAGTAVIAAMSADAVLLVLLQPGADLGALLFDLRRHRANIAALA